MAKITTQRRLSPGQRAVASAAGVKDQDIQTLTADADSIEIVEKRKSKGEGIWGFEAQLIGTFPEAMGDMAGQTYIKETLDHLVGDAAKCATAARAKWPSAVLDEGKAMKLFFVAFVERWNVFAGSTKKTWRGEIALLSDLTAMYTMVRPTVVNDSDSDAE